MTSHYIQTLGVAKCREILSGAPKGAEGVVIGNRSEIVYLKNAIFGLAFHLRDKCWVVANPEIKKYTIQLDTLRAELDQHDSDDFTHLENHISPNTVVVG